MSQPENSYRVSFASELSNIDASIGSRAWVESELRRYEALPLYCATGNGISVQVDSSPIVWEPIGYQETTSSRALTEQLDKRAVVYSFSYPDSGSVSGTLGEQVNYSHTGTIYAMRNGQRVACATNVPTVDDWGLAIQPAGDNLFAAADMVIGAAGSAWSASNCTATTGQADPFGGTSATLLDEGTANAIHQVYAYETLSGASTFSVHFKAFDSTQRYIRIADNVGHWCCWDLLTGLLTATGGSGTLARHAEYLGNGWYRASISIAAPTTGLWTIVFCNNANGTSISFTGENAKMYVSHPQWEAHGFVTDWCSPAADRPANSCFLQLTPDIFIGDWAIEFEAQPIDNGDWRASSGEDRILAQFGGLYVASSTWTLKTSGTSLILTGTGADGNTFTVTQTTALASDSKYTGPRRITVSSRGPSGNSPALWVDGYEVGTKTGTSTGALKPGVYHQCMLYLGCDKDGAQGAFRFRSVNVARQAYPVSRVRCAYSYTWPAQVGLSLRANRIAVVGDSIVQGIYTAGLTPWPLLCARALGAGWIAHNYGIGNDHGSMARARILADVLSHTDYAKIVLSFGINDLNMGVDVAHTANAIIGCADLLKHLPCDLYVTTLLPNTSGSTSIKAVNALLSAGSAAHGYTLIDTYSVIEDPASPGNVDTDLSDGLHPTQAGLTAIAAKVAESV